MEKIIEQIKKPIKFVNEETGELKVKSSLCQSFFLVNSKNFPSYLKYVQS